MSSHVGVSFGLFSCGLWSLKYYVELYTSVLASVCAYTADSNGQKLFKYFQNLELARFLNVSYAHLFDQKYSKKK